MNTPWVGYEIGSSPSSLEKYGFIGIICSRGTAQSRSQRSCGPGYGRSSRANRQTEQEGAAGSKARTVRAKTVEVNLITNGEDLEQLSALYRAAARTPPYRSKLPAGIGLWLAALGVAAAAFLSGVFLAPHSAKEASGLLLQSTDAHRTLGIRWNYKAVQNLTALRFYIDDGGRFITIPLNRSRLVSGVLPLSTEVLVSDGYYGGWQFTGSYIFRRILPTTAPVKDTAGGTGASAPCQRFGPGLKIRSA